MYPQLTSSWPLDDLGMLKLQKVWLWIKHIASRTNDLQMTLRWPWMTLRCWNQSYALNCFYNHWTWNKSSLTLIWPWINLKVNINLTFIILRMDRWTFQSKICIWPWNDLHDLDMTFTGLANGNIAMKQVLTKYCCFCYFHPKQHQKFTLQVSSPLQTSSVSSHPCNWLGRNWP